MIETIEKCRKLKEENKVLVERFIARIQRSTNESKQGNKMMKTKDIQVIVV